MRGKLSKEELSPEIDKIKKDGHDLFIQHKNELESKTFSFDSRDKEGRFCVTSTLMDKNYFTTCIDEAIDLFNSIEL